MKDQVQYKRSYIWLCCNTHENKSRVSAEEKPDVTSEMVFCPPSGLEPLGSNYMRAYFDSVFGII